MRWKRRERVSLRVSVSIVPEERTSGWKDGKTVPLIAAQNSNV
jgi:hypothetical protein